MTATDTARRILIDAARTPNDTAAIDAAAVELTAAIVSGTNSVEARRIVAQLMRAIESPARRAASRANGAAPVREGSRPRGRPRKDAV